MKLQKDVVYRIKIPKDWKHPSSLKLEDARKFFDGKLFKVTQDGCLGIKITKGILLDKNQNPSREQLVIGSPIPFWKEWLVEEIYVSPFDGQTR
jgi:hypothetical protein